MSVVRDLILQADDQLRYPTGGELRSIVEFLSNTPYWKNMAIFVTEDDAGGEPDHVDAQRSVMLVISPWAKKGYVSHRHTTVLSIHRTLYQILGLPPLNMFDALASDLSDAFTDTPDFPPLQSPRRRPAHLRSRKGQGSQGPRLRPGPPHALRRHGRRRRDGAP